MHGKDQEEGKIFNHWEKKKTTLAGGKEVKVWGRVRLGGKVGELRQRETLGQRGEKFRNATQNPKVKKF